MGSGLQCYRVAGYIYICIHTHKDMGLGLKSYGFRFRVWSVGIAPGCKLSRISSAWGQRLRI